MAKKRRQPPPFEERPSEIRRQMRKALKAVDELDAHAQAMGTTAAQLVEDALARNEDVFELRAFLRAARDEE